MPLKVLVTTEVTQELESVKRLQEIVLARMAPDLPGITFSRHFHEKPTVHAKVFEAAQKIDPKLAMKMDCYIVK